MKNGEYPPTKVIPTSNGISQPESRLKKFQAKSESTAPKPAPASTRSPNFSGVVVYQPASTSFCASAMRRSSVRIFSTIGSGAGSRLNGSRPLSVSSCSVSTLFDGSSESANKNTETAKSTGIARTNRCVGIRRPPSARP